MSFEVGGFGAQAEQGGDADGDLDQRGASVWGSVVVPGADPADAAAGQGGFAVADRDVGVGEQGAFGAGVAGADGGGEFVQALPERGGFLGGQVGLDAGEGAVLAFADAAFLGGGVGMELGVFLGRGAGEQGVEFVVELAGVQVAAACKASGWMASATGSL